MAKGIAFDKRYKGGNMTGAAKQMEKIKKGLSDHPDVSDALRKANEEVAQLIEENVRLHDQNVNMEEAAWAGNARCKSHAL